MSKTIDQKVVEMRFDNKQFEQNVSQTMSTLDRLKQKLNLTGASKGLENVNTAAKKVNMTGLGSAIETVHAKFSALQVIGVTALANITNQAVNAGKRIVSALTIDPVKTGFQEYETQINAVQTILANTQSKGTTLDHVNKALDTLNEYADKTIYNFTEMTRNIGTFTAAGVDLETSVNAIQGIANLAAVSGSNAQQASTAMYQLSQALASGTVKLMDWNSVVNAGMGGQVFQDALKETARVHGIAIDQMISEQGSFRETLSEGWLTSEILTETLQKFTLTTEGLTEAEIEANREMLRAKGYTEDQIDEIFKLGKTATDAATKVKTFTQLWDVLKESAQSGWSRTWKLIFGDFEEARNLFTPLANFLTGIINKVSDVRNTILEGALSSPVAKLVDKVANATSGVSAAVEKVKDYSDIVNRIINGEFGNGQSRWDKLTEAGYDWAHAQNLVNEKLGDGTRHATNYSEAQEKLAQTQSKSISQLAKMSDAQLKNAGYTQDQIDAIRELEKQADKAGIPLDEFVEKVDELNGRTLLINSFKNAGNALCETFTTLKKAWQDIFPPKSMEERSAQLYNMIAAVHKFSTKLGGLVDENGELTETGDKLARTFKGVFAIFDIITTIVGGGLKIAFKVLSTILSYFDLDILDITASIGDVIVKFRDWVDSVLDITDVLDKIVPYLSKFKDGLLDWIEGLKNADNIPVYIIKGLVNGLKAGGNAVLDAIIALGTGILEKIKAVLGIHSPSTEFFEIGKNIIQGLINGIQNGVSSVFNTIKGLGSKCIELLSKIDFGAVFAVGIGAGIMVLSNKMLNIVEMFGAPLEGLGDMLEGIGSAFKGLGSSLKASAWKKRGQALLAIAVAIGILAASIALLTRLDSGKMWEAIGAIAALSAIMLTLSLVAGKVGQIGSFGKQSGAILGMAAALLVLSFVMKNLTSIKGDDVPKVLGLLAGMLAGLAAMMVLFTLLAKGDNARSIDKVGSMCMKMSVALLIMLGVIKLAAKLEGGEVIKGLVVIAALELLFIAVIAVSKLAGKYGTKAGGMLLLMSGALIISIGVMKLAASMNGDDIKKGLAVIAALELLFAGIIAVSAIAGKYGTKAGAMLLMMSGALRIIVDVIKQISKLEDSEIDRGFGVIAKIELLFAAVIAVSNVAGQNALKAGGMLLLMSGALIVLTGVMFLISKMDPSGVDRALKVVSVLELLFTGLIVATGLAGDCKSTLIVLLLSVGLLIGAVAALTLLDPEDLSNSTKAITLIITSFSLLVASMNVLGKVDKIGGKLVALVGVVALLAIILGAMAKLDVKASIQSATAISILLASMAAAMVILSNAQDTTMASIGVLAVMGAVVLELALILGVMAAFNVEASIQNAVAIGILLNAMAAAMVILTNAQDVTVGSVLVLAAMGLVVLELAAILGAMSALNVEASIQSAIAIGVLLNAMTSAMLILNQAKGVTGGSVLVLAAMGLVVLELAAILGIMDYFNIEASIETALSLSVLLLGMSGALLIVSAVGGLAAAAIAGTVVLALFIAAIGGLLIGIGALMNEFPQLEEFIDTGIPILEKLGYGLGSFIGNIVGGFVGGASKGFIEIGENLSKFIKKAKPFIDGIQDIDPSAADGVKSLAQMILILTAADILQGITSFLGGGGSDLTEFGEKLAEFGPYLAEYGNAVKNIDPEVVEASATAAKTLAEFASAIPNTGGLVAAITGDNDILTFGEKLSLFGPYFAKYANAIKNMDPEVVKASATAATSLADFASEIPNSGGLVAAITGDNDILTFGQKLAVFGPYFARYATSIAGINPEVVTASATAATSLADFASAIPNSGGLVAAVTGDNDILAFGQKLALFGPCFAKYAASVAGINPEVVTASATAAQALADFAASVPVEGGLIAAITGENDIAQFGAKLAVFGQSFASYASWVAGMDTNTVTASAAAAKSLAEFADAIPKTGGLVSLITGENDIVEFGAKINEFAPYLVSFGDQMAEADMDVLSTAADSLKALGAFANAAPDVDNLEILYDFGESLEDTGRNVRRFCDQMGGIDLVSIDTTRRVARALKDLGEVNFYRLKSAGETMETLIDAFHGMANISAESVAGFNDAVTALGKTNLDAFISAFDGIEKSMSTVGETAINGMVHGVEQSTEKVYDASTGAADSCTAGIKTKYNDFFSAGAFLVQGFANGINTYSYMAKAKAAAMAAAAAKAAEEELDINSPSKVFYKIGNFAGLGFTNALGDHASDSYTAGSDLASSARSGLANAISKIKRIIDSDMEVQPTITPVLDLSNVTAGASAIGGMLNLNPSVGTISNIRSINSMMNQNQNGVGEDIVSAIKDLKKVMDDRPSGDTNIINGLTYDDGSGIAEAVHSIVQAVKMERRM